MNFIHIIKLSACVLTGLILVACGSEDSERLTVARDIADDRPDSAYVILKNIDFNGLKNNRDRAVFILTHALSNLYQERSLLTDTLLPEAMSYYKIAEDTTEYINSAIAYAHHLRASERKIEAQKLLDTLSVEMPAEIRKALNQELLSFSFEDKDYNNALHIIDRKILLATDKRERFSFQLKKIIPLLSLGREKEAAELCESLLSSPDSPEVGSNEWLNLRINYAAVLGENRETAPEATKILEDIIKRMGEETPVDLTEFYVPMVNLQINAGNLNEAEKFAGKIEINDADLAQEDPVKAAYLEFLQIVLNYERTGALSPRRLSTLAQSMRKVSDDLLVKRQERDEALETSYDLSRNNYELTIKHQRLWIIISFAILIVVCLSIFFIYIYSRRRQKLIEAEERIDTLENLLKSANNPATDEKQSLLKKLLLKQLGIIKTFVESPTSSNQEALRKISNIGNTGTPIDTLVKWEDLYSVIDELYDNFHANLCKNYPRVFSEREIQIISLIRSGFSTKEIGVIIQQISNSIYVSKTSIRKKLGLQPKEDFMDVLSSTSNPSFDA